MRLRRIWLLVLIVLPAPTGRASASFAVNATHDAPDTAPGDGVCAAADGRCTVRAAIMEANAAPGADAMSVPPGTYHLSLPGDDEDSAAAGDLDVLADLAISGSGAGTTILEGAWAGDPDRMLQLRGDGTFLQLTDVTVRGGELGSSEDAPRQGGGIDVRGGTELSLERAIVAGNRIVGRRGAGGGVYVGGVGSIRESTFVGNDVVGRGGGLNVGGGATLRNVTLTANSAVDHGGGIAVSGDVVLRNVTIARNVADRHASASGDGGGIQVLPGATATMANSIVGDNRDPSTQGPQHPDCSGTVASRGGNLVEDVSGCEGVANDLTGAGPGLVPLADNGGPTPTHALRARSPAVDVAGAGTTCEGADQRGAPRRGPCDAGAFEVVRCRGMEVRVVGTPGADVLRGGRGADGMLALGGNDRVRAGGGADAVCGGGGRDRLAGGGGGDVLLGGRGADRLRGQAGDDTLKGGRGRDRLHGGGGADACAGGRGRDRTRRC